MWCRVQPALCRHIHVSAKAEAAKINRADSKQSQIRIHSKGLLKIQLPNSWRAKIAEFEAIRYWKRNVPSGGDIARRNKPLVLEIDRQLGRKTTCTPNGIRLVPTDPLGVKLGKIGKSTPCSARWSRQSRWIRWTSYYVIFTVSVFCLSQEKVPIVGLRRFNCIPHWLSERERRIDFDNRGKLLQGLQGHVVPQDHPIAHRVRSILERVVRASGLEHINWDIQIIIEPEVVNVAVTPSGQVFLFSGIFDIANEDDELAAVLGHEIAHILAHHNAQHLSTLCLIGAISPPLIPCGILGGIGLLGVIELLPFWLPILGVAGIYYAFSRDRESEADYIGLILMADAGFDPSAAASVWRKMNILEERKLLELKRQHPAIDEASLKEGHYMSTHPHTPLRIIENEKWAPEVLQIVGKSALAPSLVAKPVGDLMNSRRNWEQFVKTRDQNRS